MREGTAVGDADHDGFTVGQVGDAGDGAEGEGFVGGGHAGAVVGGAIGGAMTAGAVPAGHAGFDELGAASGGGDGLAIAARLFGFALADGGLGAQRWRRWCVGVPPLMMAAGGEGESGEGEDGEGAGTWRERWAWCDWVIERAIQWG